MRTTSRHIIKQQILDVTISNLKDQEEISSAVSDIYKKNIDTILDDICYELNIPKNEIIKIDSLDIDLGHFKYDQLALDFPKMVKNSVKEALFKQIRDKKNGSSISKEMVTVYQHNQSALISYLKTGLIPWYYDGNLSKLISEFSSKVIKSSDQLFTEIGVVFNEESCIKRAVHFFEEKVVYSFLMEQFSKDHKSILIEFIMLKKVLGKLKTVSNTSVIGSSLISSDITFLLEYVKPKGELYDKIMIRLIQLISSSSFAKRKYLVEIVPKKYGKKLLELFQFIGDNKLEKLKILTPEEYLWIQKFCKNTKNKSIPELQNYKKKTKIIVNQKTPIVIKEGVVIKNAGMILIWPYLQAFFTGLNMMKDKSFINIDNANRAVHLLHYLVFQTEESNETEWILNKLICGIEVTGFIPEKISISQEEKEECDNLLSALINNWSALKNTSPESLRQTFLQRDGLLSHNENGWVLKIKREAYDILLDKLTWSISVIRLPWNNYMIHTEW